MKVASSLQTCWGLSPRQEPPPTHLGGEGLNMLTQRRSWQGREQEGTGRPRFLWSIRCERAETQQTMPGDLYITGSFYRDPGALSETLEGASQVSPHSQGSGDQSSSPRPLGEPSEAAGARSGGTPSRAGVPLATLGGSATSPRA